ncbi:MAG: type I-E CRISPR-associated endoribonuclease Cas2 [Planctomycetes bacterium]|nr:type I-E CRISPR-associated endoribonuclease Cas2 [Planctomycetota bacterium]
MPFTVVITRSAPPRTRGFLASAMLEIAPGVYVAPQMSRGVRERVWGVMLEWASLLPADGGVLMSFSDNSAPGGQAIRLLGFPKTELVDRDGFWLVRRDVAEDKSSRREASVSSDPEA